ncbi:MAG: helix-hairpin-helix domain-containing protein [Bacteroidales bacterium]|nr:helix-hairpin-helix domain-containing protein [Bacteroidales bacterium]
MIKSDRIRRWFGYSRRERQGTYLLSVILLLVITARLSGLIGPGEEREEGIADADTIPATAQPFMFDPNSADIDELVSLGLTQRQATTLSNYRKAGGRFRKPEDFRKIYGIDSSVRERLIPFIYIAEAPPEHWHDASQTRTAEKKRAVGGSPGIDPAYVERPNDKKSYGETLHYTSSYHERGDQMSREEESPPPAIDLNSADSLLLKSLPGIGDVLSVRIVKYRNILGGFISVNQIEEVYGIDSLLADRLKPLLVADRSLVRQVNINSAGYGDFLRHPYISESEASMIISYRDRVGTIGSVSELVLNRIFDRERYEKVFPYLTAGGDTAHLW